MLILRKLCGVRFNIYKISSLTPIGVAKFNVNYFNNFYGNVMMEVEKTW